MAIDPALPYETAIDFSVDKTASSYLIPMVELGSQFWGDYVSKSHLQGKCFPAIPEPCLAFSILDSSAVVLGLAFLLNCSSG